MPVPVTRFALVSGLLFAIATAAHFAPSASGAAQAPSGVKVGDAAPDFTLPAPTLQQTEWSLAKDGKGKIVVISFDSFTCPVAQALRERWNKLAGSQDSTKVAFVSVFSNKTEPQADVVKGAEKNKAAAPVLIDADNKVADLYGATRTPHIYIVDTAGKIAYVGAIDDDWEGKKVTKTYAADAIAALVAGKTVPVASTEAVGCSIKRK